MEKILIIAGSGIGNILLATPLVRSLRSAYPLSTIDVLVPKGRGDILEGNPDVSEVVEVCRGEGLREYLRFFQRMWRNYDVALSLRACDRSIVNAWIAGRKRISHVKGKRGPQWWQRCLLDDWIVQDFDTHVVIQGLRLLDTLGVPRRYEVTPPVCGTEEREDLDRRLGFDRALQAYAVLHLCSRNPYKCWTIGGWAEVIRCLTARGLAIVLTGCGGQEEQGYIRSVVAQGGAEHVVDLSGSLSLPQVSELIRKCTLYVGLDTGVTHLAASLDIPTLALYGPSNPVYWGPWPTGYSEDRSPFVRRVCQRTGNVSVIRHDEHCIGCGKEGCDDNPHNQSRCMQNLEVQAVLNAIDELSAREHACLSDCPP